MKVAAIEIEHYRLPLRTPLSSPSGLVTERRGLIVSVSTEGLETIGVGEAAPAYWLGGGDSIELAAEEIGSVRLALETGGYRISDVVDAAARLRSPSARCALETAALDLVARRRGVAFAALLAELPSGEIDLTTLARSNAGREAGRNSTPNAGPVTAAAADSQITGGTDCRATAGWRRSSGVAAGTGPGTVTETCRETAASKNLAMPAGSRPTDAAKQAVAPEIRNVVDVAALCVSETVTGLTAEVAGLAQRGFRTFKLKVGRRDPSADLERIAVVHRAMPGGSRLRLDANRAWSLDEALRFLSAVGDRYRERVEYVEEPLARPAPDDLARLARDAELPVALDESAGCPADLEALAAAGGVTVVVLKLARTGGPLAALALAGAAARLGVEAVVTDSIESRVGRAAAVHTAVAVAMRTGRAESGVPNVPAVGLGGAFLLAGEPRGLQAEVPGSRYPVNGPGLSVQCP